MIKHVSTRVALVVLSACLAGGCVDAQGRLEEFDDRVEEQEVGELGPGCQECDITGRHYLAIDPSVDADPTHLIHYIVEVTMVEGEAKTATVKFIALDFTMREVVEGAVDLTGDQLLVSDGNFRLPLTDAEIPAEANSVLAGQMAAIVTTGEILTKVIDDDTFCGLINGETNLGTALDGSTFGALRVGADDIGAALPDPIVDCPPALR